MSSTALAENVSVDWTDGALTFRSHAPVALGQGRDDVATIATFSLNKFQTEEFLSWIDALTRGA